MSFYYDVSWACLECIVELGIQASTRIDQWKVSTSKSSRLLLVDGRLRRDMLNLKHSLVIYCKRIMFADHCTSLTTVTVLMNFATLVAQDQVIEDVWNLGKVP